MATTKEKSTKASKATKSETRAKVRASTRDSASGTPLSIDRQVREAIAALKKMGTKQNRDGLARYGIIARNVLGVSVGNIRQLGKRLGRNHELALALWKTDYYEARMLTSFVGEPARVTSGQMDRWCRDFDNWAICDTLCFHLFDRTPHAWAKVAQWKDKRSEFEKRAAFALLASLAGHDKSAPDERFLEGLQFIEAAATDPRNFVKKAVNWALRGIGKRNATLRPAAIAVSQRLAESTDRTARWIGKDALRELKR